MKNKKITLDKPVSFCMRCFGISVVPIDEYTNFCHNCGSGGTCISMKKEDSEYLRTNIMNVIKSAKKNK